MKKMMKKSVSILSCVGIYLVGLLTADLVKPMIEKIPVVGDLFASVEDKLSPIVDTDDVDDLDED
tara:strand:- start:1196 stop:1390 length:195 start_codon:yes stop_codon:yes gene_type:complete